MHGGIRMTSQPKLAGAALLMFGAAVLGVFAPASPQTLGSRDVSSGPLAAPQAGSAQAKPTVAHKRTQSAAATKKKAAARSGAKSAADGKTTAAKAPDPWMAVDPGRAAHAAGDAPLPAEPKSVVSHYGTNEPLEIGGKWSGSNDTAEKTRVDNYNANAAGTGGEVGLKLHF